MKRSLLTIVLVVAAVGLVFAGAQDEGEMESSALSILKAGSETLWDEYYTASFERYSAATGHDVEFEYASVGWPDANTRINVMFAGGSAPDIIAAAVGYLAVRASNGQFIPLDSYMESWEDRAFYQEEAYAKGLYQGQFYGLGYHWDPRILIYRKDLFRESGLDPERPPETWETLAEYAEKLTRRDGNVIVQSGLEMPSSQTHVFSYIFLNQNGTRLADEVSEEPMFLDPAGVETFQYLADLYAIGVSAPHAGNNPAEQPFLRGTAAMGFTTPSQLSQFIESFPELEQELGFIYNLKRTNEATFGGMYQYFITNQSEDPDLAWDYLTYMMSEDETRARIDALNSPPTRTDMLEEFIGRSRFNEAIMNSALISYPWPNVTWSALYRRHLDEVGMKTYLAGEDPLSVLEFHQAELEAELAQ